MTELATASYHTTGPCKDASKSSLYMKAPVTANSTMVELSKGHSSGLVTSVPVQAGTPGSGKGNGLWRKTKLLVAELAESIRFAVPLEKGYTQADWFKLVRSHPDLAGLGPGHQPRQFISMEEVRSHRSRLDCWTVLKGKVYNITPYMKFHPGGAEQLFKGAGQDCTALFRKHHPWVNAEALLAKCFVGYLEQPPQ